MFSSLALHAQTPAFRPLHVSPAGIILDDSGKPVLLRGLNRSGTGSGNADATATDADYAAQNQLLSMNLVRIFVNAAWWTNNVQVPIANQPYQSYIDTLIQRAKKYGNYVLILKAGQFPDPPCGASGTNCPAPNQGDLNCQANPSLCPAQDTTGNTIDTAFNFWAAFAKKYAADPAVLYDTWEDMHGIDSNTWSDDQNQLIAAIRTYSPQSLIFVEDTGTAFESIVAGTLPDLAWSNIVWNFHLYTASTGTCTEPASPRYANWPQNFDPAGELRTATRPRRRHHGMGRLQRPRAVPHQHHVLRSDSLSGARLFRQHQSHRAVGRELSTDSDRHESCTGVYRDRGGRARHGSERQLRVPIHSARAGSHRFGLRSKSSES